MTFYNVSQYGVLSLLNSNNYQLMSIMGRRNPYTASYPANGDMKLLFKNGHSWYYADTVDIRVEWECEDTLVVPPAVGYDSSDYLTLPQEGMYQRPFSLNSDYKWIIPCTGTLSIAENLGNIFSAYVIFTNSNGSRVLFQYVPGVFETDYWVDGNFVVELSNQAGERGVDNFFSLSWSCESQPNSTGPATDLPAGATFAPPHLPALPTLPPTPSPDTAAPPTFVPVADCLEMSSPLNVSFPPESPNGYAKCWSFQCVGTVHMTFFNVSQYGVLSLLNSNNYQLMSIMGRRNPYTASYPANGDMKLLFKNGHSWYYADTVDIRVEWECEDTLVVPPAVGYDSSDYLTLPQEGMYQRPFSLNSDYKWIIPCTGTLSIAENLGNIFSAYVIFTNSNGSRVLFQYVPGVFETDYWVDGNFVVELSNQAGERGVDNFFSLSWSCESHPNSTGPATDLPAGATFAPPTAVPHFTSPTTLPAGETALPPTATPTDLPAGASFAPPTPAPDTALPTATPTDLPAGATFAPPTAVPHFTSPTTLPAGETALPPTATPTDLPAGASFAPPTPAPDTALPTATPTDLPAGATFAPLPPAVNALCTADKDCRSGRLDPKATCNAGTCVCHTQGYAHPPGVPLCLLADDVTVAMAFAVEYGVGARSSWTTTATTAKERFEDTMGEALGTVTDMRVVVSYAGVLVVGMVRASTVKLANALSGKLNLAAALSSEGASVSHGVTCTSTDASYTVQYNGVCNAVECEGSTTLTLADGTYTCESEAEQPDVVLYVGIGVGVGVLVLAVGIVVACCLKRKQQGQHPKELANPLFEMPLQESDVYPLGTEEAEETLN